MGTIRMIAVAVGAALLLGACGGGGNGQGGAGGGGAGGGGGGGGETVTLTAQNFAFDPTSLTVATGGGIEFANEDDAAHSFTAKKAGLNEVVDPGSTVTIDLGDVQAGSYDFKCRFHSSMRGTLEVTG